MVTKVLFVAPYLFLLSPPPFFSLPQFHRPIVNTFFSPLSCDFFCLFLMIIFSNLIPFPGLTQLDGSLLSSV